MNQHNHNIDDLFASWGQNEHQLPPRNETLKREALVKFAATPFSEESPFSPRPFPWPSLVLVGVSVFIFILNVSGGATRPLSVSFTAPTEQGGALLLKDAPGVDGGVILENQDTAAPASQEASLGVSSLTEERAIYNTSLPPPMFWDEEIPATDTREFLKTDYYAQIRTRRVEELTDRLALTVRGLGGRIDSMSRSRHHGFIEFVVPESEFEVFRMEIERSVRGRFLVQNVTTENLLPEKQLIEEEREELDTALTGLSANRKQVISAHNQTIAAIQSRLNAIAEELAYIEAKRGGTTKEKAARAARKSELLAERSTLTTRLANENAAYATKIGSLDTRISNARAGIQRNDEQDQELLDTVATVRGTISLQWISVWEVIQMYGAAYWLAPLFLVLAIVAYLFPLRRYRPEVM